MPPVQLALEQLAQVLEALEEQLGLVQRVRGVPVVLLERRVVEERELLDVLEHQRVRKRAGQVAEQRVVHEALAERQVLMREVVVAVVCSRTQTLAMPPLRRLSDIDRDAAVS